MTLILALLMEECQLVGGASTTLYLIEIDVALLLFSVLRYLASTMTLYNKPVGRYSAIY